MIEEFNNKISKSSVYDLLKNRTKKGDERRVNNPHAETNLNDVNKMQLVSFSVVVNGNRHCKFIKTNALFDTGSPVSFIGKSMLQKHIKLSELCKSKYYGLCKTSLYILMEI